MKCAWGMVLCNWPIKVWQNIKYAFNPKFKNNFYITISLKPKDSPKKCKQLDKNQARLIMR